MKRSDIFYGKIILFGEYGIIFDSMALTIPFTHFHGELSFNNRNNKFKYTDVDFANASNLQLENYVRYLQQLMDTHELKCDFDLAKLTKDLSKGLYFESSIPQGFGLGSSGALVAALYKHYGKNRLNGGRSVSPQDTLKLKEILAQMESFFHGKSSGIDPLNSYIQFPLLIKSKRDISTVGIPRNKFNGNSGIFLVNTGKPGKTEPLVNLFLENCKKPDYMQVINEQYIPLNNACIQNLIQGELESFFENLNQFSELQFHYFGNMIPEAYKSVWQDGLSSGDFNLKLCGSGGGGYLLGFAPDLVKAQQYFIHKQLETVTVYKSAKD